MTFKTAGSVLTVVGWFDGGDSALDSELWMDADEARSIFDRENFSSLLVHVTDFNAAAGLMQRIESDKRRPLRADFEMLYYAAQTTTALPIKMLGHLQVNAMSIGAVFAAMNTLHASVASRAREIGTLRVLGFHRRTMLASFIIEGTILAGFGGLLSCLVALSAQYLCVAFGIRFGTLSFSTTSAR